MKRGGTRPKPLNRQQLAAILREQILAGVYQPGTKLPSRNEMCAQVASSYVTIQAAVSQLVSEGFIRTRFGAGTYVADHPPHLCHYGMLINKDITAVQPAGQDRFLRTLVQAAEHFNAHETGRRIRLWYDPPANVARTGYHELLAMTQARRLAGVIYPHPPASLLKTPLFAVAGVFHVTAAVPPLQAPGLGHVVFQMDTFYQRAIARIAAAGRRRLAVLTTASNLSLGQGQLPERLASWAAPYGLTMRPFWTIPIDPCLAPGVKATTHLLFDAPANQRPDALIIDDDHMVSAATEALAAAGVNTQSEVTVIGHCNYPNPPAAAVPIIRLGLDCREMLERMIAFIDHRIRGEPIAPVTWLKAIFETELKP